MDTDLLKILQAYFDRNDLV